jgi:hypothetical protein
MFSQIDGYSKKVRSSKIIMNNAFVVPEIAAIYNTIEELFYMVDPQPPINISFGKDEDKEENVYEFIRFGFRLKNGNVDVKVYEDTGSFEYTNWSGQSVHSIEFDDTEFASMTGSFYQAFKSVIAFDRQQANTAKITNTSFDRASFGLAEVN